jgi:hypothetical protein
MTVKQLIDILDRLDPDLEVFTRGYEGGYEYAELKGAPIDVALDYYNDDEWWYGRHQVVDLVTDNKENYKIVKGIIL